MNSRQILKKRVYALTVDYFFIIVTNYFLMASFTQFIKTVFFHFPLRAQLFFIYKLQMMSSITLMTLAFAYFSIFYYTTNGRTLGKTFFSLKVQSPEGDITLSQAMKRSIAYFICAMMGSFLFALSFIRKDRKSLADLFSGTSVVLDEKLTAPAQSKTEFQLSLLEAQQEIEAPEQEEAKAA